MEYLGLPQQVHLKMTHSDKPAKNILISVIVIITCVTLITVYFLQHRDEFLLIKNFSLIHIVLILGILAVNNAIHSYRTLIILRNMGLETIRTFQWLRIFTISRFINFYVTQGANLYRIAKLKKDYNFSYTRSISMTAFFTWLDINFFLLIALICTVVLSGGHGDSYTKSFNALLLTLLTCFFAPFVLKYLFQFLPSSLKFIDWLKSKFLILTGAFFIEIKKVKTLALYFGLTSIFFFFLAIVIKICFHSLGYDIKPNDLFLFTLIFVLSRTINIVPGNLGLAEIICGYFSEFLGANIGSGIIVSTIIRILNFILISTLSLCLNKFKIPDKTNEDLYFEEKRG